VPTARPNVNIAPGYGLDLRYMTRVVKRCTSESLRLSTRTTPRRTFPRNDFGTRQVQEAEPLCQPFPTTRSGIPRTRAPQLSVPLVTRSPVFVTTPTRRLKSRPRRVDDALALLSAVGEVVVTTGGGAGGSAGGGGAGGGGGGGGGTAKR
jgi:hypothetical protein